MAEEKPSRMATDLAANIRRVVTLYDPMSEEMLACFLHEALQPWCDQIAKEAREAGRREILDMTENEDSLNAALNRAFREGEKREREKWVAGLAIREG